jgi:hypothetical protein
MSEGAMAFNPDFDPNGSEGGVDTNALPWLPLSGVPGTTLKPLRASMESGMFNLIVRLERGAVLEKLLCLAGMDLLVLSGELSYSDDQGRSTLEPGVWGYMSANTCLQRLEATEDTELLANFYGAFALLSASHQVARLVTSADIRQVALQAGISMVPNTLAECMAPRTDYRGAGEPLSIGGGNAGHLIAGVAAASPSTFKHPYFIDCRAVPWVVNPDLPDIGLKVLRVSQETGFISVMVRHNGVAAPHNHIGGADFLVLEGRLGVRAGPPEGYGPGTWFYEPPGARHDATQRVTDEDLIYTANIYGPLVFDSGLGTPVVAVLSWMEYVALAEAGGAKLVANTFSDDSSLLAWAPIGVSV